MLLQISEKSKYCGDFSFQKWIECYTATLVCILATANRSDIQNLGELKRSTSKTFLWKIMRNVKLLQVFPSIIVLQIRSTHRVAYANGIHKRDAKDSRSWTWANRNVIMCTYEPYNYTICDVGRKTAYFVRLFHAVSSVCSNGRRELYDVYA